LTGHHSVIPVEKAYKWLIDFGRQPLGETDGDHRVTCMDVRYFDENGIDQTGKDYV
jgi:hypothetical protein